MSIKKYIKRVRRYLLKGIPEAVIPVRAGSARLKNKNVAPFAGTNLLLNKILDKAGRRAA